MSSAEAIRSQALAPLRRPRLARPLQGLRCRRGASARGREGWDYFRAVREGSSANSGAGAVDFPAVLDELRRAGYDGWIVVEQDVLPSMGAPAGQRASATAIPAVGRPVGVGGDVDYMAIELFLQCLVRDT